PTRIPPLAWGRERAPSTDHCWVVTPNSSSACVPLVCSVFAAWNRRKNRRLLISMEAALFSAVRSFIELKGGMDRALLKREARPEGNGRSLTVFQRRGEHEGTQGQGCHRDRRRRRHRRGG